MVDGILMFRRGVSGGGCRGLGGGCRGVRRLGGLLEMCCCSSQSSLRLRMEARELRPGQKAGNVNIGKSHMVILLHTLAYSFLFLF